MKSPSLLSLYSTETACCQNLCISHPCDNVFLNSLLLLKLKKQFHQHRTKISNVQVQESLEMLEHTKIADNTITCIQETLEMLERKKITDKTITRKERPESAITLVNRQSFWQKWFKQKKLKCVFIDDD